MTIAKMQKSKLFKSASLVGLVLACGTLMASNLAHKDNKQLNLSVTDVSSLFIDAKAGSLIVEGDDSKEISVSAQLAVADENYVLTLERKGDRAVLVADPNPENESNWYGESPYINLMVKLPKGLSLKIEDGSGFIEVSEMDADVSIQDGSGSLKVSNVAGQLTIKDGSGGITLDNIGGIIKIKDGSGGIELRQAGSDVFIDDGSGGIEVSDVKGDVDIEDGSGSLSVKKVNGNVTLDDGSGSIHVNDVSKDLVIKNAGSGGVSINGVKGRVSQR